MMMVMMMMMMMMNGEDGDESAVCCYTFCAVSSNIVTPLFELSVFSMNKFSN